MPPHSRWQPICNRYGSPINFRGSFENKEISMATMVETFPRTDASIRESVISELKWDPKLSTSDDIAVAVKDGVVTLSGYVPSYYEKDEAEKAAKRVYGVKAVANDNKGKSRFTRTHT